MHGTTLSPVRARLVALFFAMLAAVGARAAPLQAARYGDFDHYTFALTWQPGFCSTDGGCLSDQPHDVLIGLHGLWASRPQSLIRRGISDPKWWARGCDYYHHSDSAPPLAPATLKRLDAVMPHLEDSLLTHEYDKHVQCFGFDPQTFFQTELQMRRGIISSAFGRYLTATARGHTVWHADVIRTFARDFGTSQASSLQLQCHRNDRGQVVLTQLWITLYRDALPRFPRDDSFMNAPVAQDNCPARFLVPDWR